VTRPASAAIPAVAGAIVQRLSATGVTDQLDFAAFDTCLLGSAEAACEFVGLAAVYIASGEIDYGPGWDYTAAFSSLSAKMPAAVAMSPNCD
jgi:hypothetical protein